MRTIIFTEMGGNKARLLKELFPAWEIYPVLEKSRLPPPVRNSLELPSQCLQRLIDLGPSPEVIEIIRKEWNNFDHALIITDPDNAWDTDAFILHQYLYNKGRSAYHLQTLCLEKRWLKNEILQAKKRLEDQFEKKQKGEPPVISRAETYLLTSLINMTAARSLKLFSFDYLTGLGRKVELREMKWATRACLLLLQSIRELQREEKEVIHDITLLYDHMATNPNVQEHDFWDIAVPSSSFLESARQNAEVKNTRNLLPAWNSFSDRFTDKPKNLVERNYAINPNRQEPVQILRFDQSAHAVTVCKYLQINPKVKILGQMEVGDWKELTTPLTLRELMLQSFKHPHLLPEPIQMMQVLFVLYNAGLITWPKVSGSKSPDHIMRLFSDHYQTHYIFDKHRNPSNEEDLDNKTEWIISPTNPEVYNIETVGEILTKETNIRKADIPQYFKVYNFIFQKFLKYNVHEKHNSIKSTWAVGPVDDKGQLIDPNNTFFFRKKEHPRTKSHPAPGTIHTLSAFYVTTYADPIQATQASLCYLLVRNNLIQPSTVSKKMDELKGANLMTTIRDQREEMEINKEKLRVLQQGQKAAEKVSKADLTPAQIHQNQKRNESIRNIELLIQSTNQWFREAERLLQDRSKAETNADTQICTNLGEKLMRALEGQFPMLVIPNEARELHKKTQDTAKGGISADNVYLEFHKTLESQSNTGLPPDPFDRVEERKFAQ